MAKYNLITSATFKAIVIALLTLSPGANSFAPPGRFHHHHFFGDNNEDPEKKTSESALFAQKNTSPLGDGPDKYLIVAGGIALAVVAVKFKNPITDMVNLVNPIWYMRQFDDYLGHYFRSGEATVFNDSGKTVKMNTYNKSDAVKAVPYTSVKIANGYSGSASALGEKYSVWFKYTGKSNSWSKSPKDIRANEVYIFKGPNKVVDGNFFTPFLFWLKQR